MDTLRPTSPCTSSTTDEESTNLVRLSPPNPSLPVEKLGVSSKDPILQGFNNFKKSGAPSRFFLFENNSWVEFAKPVFDELTSGFEAGKPVFEVSVGGNSYLVDFLRMFRIELSTGARSSIAWVDVNGQCFFPPMDTQHVENSGCLSTRGLQKFGKEEESYKFVEKFFLQGMREFDPEVAVTSVAKCLGSGPSRCSRNKFFSMMMDMMKEARGDANMKVGWYGVSGETVEAIVDHGFGKPNSEVLGLEAHGHGLHLSTPHFPYTSSLFSPAADNGEKQIIMCRVIMGHSERVEAGSLQSHPSNKAYDSGVDDLYNPRWYIVWRSHMNTHIIPEYVVSFRSSNQLPGLGRGVSSARRPTGFGCLPFQKLLSEMGKSLPPSTMQDLASLHNQHREGKLTKDTFVRRLRSLVGDKILSSTIRKLKGHY